MARIVLQSLAVGCALAGPAHAQFMPGDLYVGAWPDAIYRVEPGTWNVTLFADASDGLNGVSAICFSPDAQLLCSNFRPCEVVEFDAAGDRSVRYDKSSGLSGPYGENGLAFDAAGNLFVSDFNRQEIRFLPADGGPPSVLADDQDGIVFADGLAFAANGDLYVANRRAKQVLRIDPAGDVALFDSLPDDPYSIVIRGNGDLYVACGLPTSIYRYPGGDVAQRTLFAKFPGNGGNPALQLSPDGTTLYLTSFATGNLLTIDPDTANAVEVIPAHGIPGAIAIGVFGGGRIDAKWANYGAGLAGTSGVPSFTSREDPVLGTTNTLDLANSAPTSTAGLLFVGFQRTQIPSTWGGDLLVVPLSTISLAIPVGGLSFTGDLPADRAYAGLTILLQALEADPGAVKGVSFTAGLELLLGD